jgi:hypothetical protein
MQKIIAKEKKKPLGWFYLSFAGKSGFLGGVIVEAHGVVTATRRASDLNINPGGEVMCCPIPEDKLHMVPEDLRNRLLSEREVRDRLEGRRVGE